MCDKMGRAVFAMLTVVFSLTQSAMALPWDIDMYRQESLKSGEVARGPVTGTVPVGARPFTLSVEEADKSLSKPLAQSFTSAWRGKRLWNANCLPCHGKSGAGEGAVSKLFVGVPNLLQELYRGRSDGRLFAVITLGQNAMPRYGYKFSEEERWDIINYLRFLQGEDVAGLARPVAMGN